MKSKDVILDVLSGNASSFVYWCENAFLNSSRTLIHASNEALEKAVFTSLSFLSFLMIQIKLFLDVLLRNASSFAYWCGNTLLNELHAISDFFHSSLQKISNLISISFCALSEGILLSYQWINTNLSSTDYILVILVFLLIFIWWNQSKLFKWMIESQRENINIIERNRISSINTLTLLIEAFERNRISSDERLVLLIESQDKQHREILGYLDNSNKELLKAFNKNNKKLLKAFNKNNEGLLEAFNEDRISSDQRLVMVIKNQTTNQERLLGYMDQWDKSKTERAYLSFGESLVDLSAEGIKKLGSFLPWGN